MEIKLGTLTFAPAQENQTLMAASVASALERASWPEDVGVTEIDPTLSDTAAFCEHYQTKPEQAANCVIVVGKRGEEKKMAAVMILASTRADINGAVRKTLDVRKVSFAPMEEAVKETGMEHGAITPLGLPPDWPILIDKAVAESPYVIIGSGIRKSKLAVPGSYLASLPHVQVIEGLAQPMA